MKKNYTSTCIVFFALLLGMPKYMQGKNLILPTVSYAEVPLYPALARAANISGIVHVIVTTDGHVVLTAHAEGGHKLLRDAAEKNVMSWKFTTHEPTKFTVTFDYSLVHNMSTRSNNPRVVLLLPTNIEVEALRMPGTHDMPPIVPKGTAFELGTGPGRVR
jgi:hypothetical protein